MLFLRGNAISGAPIRIGTKTLPNPPIRIGLTIKKNHKEGMSSNYNIIKLIITCKNL